MSVVQHSSSKFKYYHLVQNKTGDSLVLPYELINKLLKWCKINNQSKTITNQRFNDFLKNSGITDDKEVEYYEKVIYYDNNLKGFDVQKISKKLKFNDVFTSRYFRKASVTFYKLCGLSNSQCDYLLGHREEGVTSQYSKYDQNHIDVIENKISEIRTQLLNNDYYNSVCQLININWGEI